MFYRKISDDLHEEVSQFLLFTDLSQTTSQITHVLLIFLTIVGTRSQCDIEIPLAFASPYIADIAGFENWFKKFFYFPL